MAQLKRVKFTNVDASARQLATASASAISMGLKAFHVYNPNTSDVFVKFYDESSGNVTVGTTAVHYGAFLVPASSQLILGSDSESSPLIYFNDNICVAVTTTEPDTGSTSPTTDCTVEITYWGD